MSTERSDAGRALAALRPAREYVCAMCGAVIVRRAKARTCSNRCRTALRYRGVRERRIAARGEGTAA